jgi:hypothetical protein
VPQIIFSTFFTKNRRFVNLINIYLKNSLFFIEKRLIGLEIQKAQSTIALLVKIVLKSISLNNHIVKLYIVYSQLQRIEETVFFIPGFLNPKSKDLYILYIVLKSNFFF